MLRRSCARLVQANGWRYESCGLPAKVLKQESWDTGSVAQGFVLVKLSAASIQQQDIGMVMGNLCGYQAPKYPAVGGMEGVGTVEAVGAGVAGLAKGDKVVLSAGDVGSWATYAMADAGSVDKVSGTSLGDAELACMSALCGAVRMAADFGDVNGAVCVVLGAESGVGTALCAALKAKGGVVLAVKSGEAVPTKPAQFIFNGVGGAALAAAVSTCEQDCTVVTFGNSSGERMSLPGSRAVLSGTDFVPFWYPRWQRSATPAERQATYKEAEALAKSVKLATKPFKFQQFAAAFDAAVDGTVPVLTIA